MMRRTTLAFRSALGGIFALIVVASSGLGHALAAASPWVTGPKAQARLVSGGSVDRDRAALVEDGKRLAFVEILLEPGWKTYWRTPGDAGGLPPSFDWSKSANLAHAEVLYPAPRRFTDRSGNTIGYEGGLVLPVVLTPERQNEPISLALDFHYGICKDVCVPVDAALSVEVKAGEADAAALAGLSALEAVPRAQDKLRPLDPQLVSASGILGGSSPKITIEARFPGGAAGADVFLEAPDSLYLPLPALKTTKADGTLVFEAELDGSVDVAQLEGKAVTVTLVSETGASVATFLVE